MQWTASAYNTPEQTAITYYTATKYGRDFCELLWKIIILRKDGKFR